MSSYMDSGVTHFSWLGHIAPVSVASNKTTRAIIQHGSLPVVGWLAPNTASIGVVGSIFRMCVCVCVFFNYQMAPAVESACYSVGRHNQSIRRESTREEKVKPFSR